MDTEELPPLKLNRVSRVQILNTSAPTIIEIEKALSSLKLNKAPGIDYITSEMLRAETVYISW